MASVLAPSGAQTSIVGTMPRTSGQMLATRLLKQSVHDIATALGKDESTASRVRASERAITIQEFCDILELVGLKLVDKTKQCVPSDELSMLRRVYALHNKVDLWSDPE